MDFIKEFFGSHSVGFHVAGFLFALIGALIIKRIFWLRHLAQCQGVCEHPKFSASHWIKNNWVDLAYGQLAAFVTVRFSDIITHSGWVIEKATALGWKSVLSTPDTVFFYLFIGAAWQWYTHRKARKNKIEINSSVGGGGPKDPKGDG